MSARSNRSGSSSSPAATSTPTSPGSRSPAAPRARGSASTSRDHLIMPKLTYSIEDGVATLVLNHPPQNRIEAQMASELAEALDAVERSDARVVLLRADGPDFSFGGD